jgi:transposase
VADPPAWPSRRWPFRTPSRSLGLEGGKGLSEVATELGVSTGQLSTWRTEYLAAGSAEALAARKAEEAEMQRLRREVKRLEEENLILRKAAAVFAKGAA